ncbi:MAG: hypothetical protein KDA61_16900, partial [Planctomycetales bacterium]|nr:hypothetical protein [Planctomycetales bacterium]
KLAALTAPLGLAAGLCSLESNAPRYVVQWQFGEHELAIIGVVTYVTLVGQTVLAAVGQSAVPRMAALHSARERGALRQLVTRLALAAGAVGLVCAAGSWAFGRQLLQLAFGPTYAERHHLLTILTLAAAFQYTASMLSAALRSTGQFSRAMTAHLASLTTVAIGSWIGGRLWGVTGVACGSLAASIAASLLFGALVYDSLLRERRPAAVDASFDQRLETLRRSA